MADYIIDGAILTDIADAIRGQTGSTEAIVPESMADEVAAFVCVKEHETWTITLADGTVVEKEVALL